LRNTYFQQIAVLSSALEESPDLSLSPFTHRRNERNVGKGTATMKRVTRNASLRVTAELGVVVAAGAGFALFHALAAPTTSLHPESQARRPQRRLRLQARTRKALHRADVL